MLVRVFSRVFEMLCVSFNGMVKMWVRFFQWSVRKWVCVVTFLVSSAKMADMSPFESWSSVSSVTLTASHFWFPINNF